MKKLITTVALGLVSMAPLAAEDYPIDLLVRDMGYTEPLITVDTVVAVKKANADAKKYYATKKLDSVKPAKASSVSCSSNGMTIDDMLKPRISDAVESTDMIPALMRYHKANPKSEKITRKLAATTYSAGQYKEALYWYTLTYQRDRSDFESLWNMACIADSIGEKDQARVYLKQYVKVDPMSGWGRMAKDILNNGYQSSNMSDSFEDEISRFLDSSSAGTESDRNSRNSVKSSDSDGTDGMIVVSGDKYDLESFVASNNKKNFTETKTDNDTLKGKSQKVNQKPVQAAKTSLDNARIAAPVTPANNKASTEAKVAVETPKTAVESSKPNVETPKTTVETPKASNGEFDSVTAVAEPLGD